jgi:hypothetical protein
MPVSFSIGGIPFQVLGFTSDITRVGDSKDGWAALSFKILSEDYDVAGELRMELDEDTLQEIANASGGLEPLFGVFENDIADLRGVTSIQEFNDWFDNREFSDKGAFEQQGFENVFDEKYQALIHSASADGAVVAESSRPISPARRLAEALLMEKLQSFNLAFSSGEDYVEGGVTAEWNVSFEEGGTAVEIEKAYGTLSVEKNAGGVDTIKFNELTDLDSQMHDGLLKDLESKILDLYRH